MFLWKEASFLSSSCEPRSRGSTGRTTIEPEGNQSYESVWKGNVIAARTLVLMYVAAALGAWWVLEQPVNSLMQELPCFQRFSKQIKTYRYSLCMKDYGGPTTKPTWLYSGTSTYFWIGFNCFIWSPCFLCFVYFLVSCLIESCFRISFCLSLI